MWPNPQFPADIWSHSLKKSLMENFFFCAVSVHAMTTLHCNFVFTLYWHRSIFSLQRWTSDSKKWSDIFFYSSAKEIEWKLSKYRVFSGSYFHVFSVVRIRWNTDQEKLLFGQFSCSERLNYHHWKFCTSFEQT